MNVIAVLSISILVQLAAAYLALRLIRVTGKRPAWLFIGGALCLMALRRLITLYDIVFLGAPTRLDLTVETVGLAVSLLMAAGLAGIAPLILSIRNSEEALRLNESRLQALWDLSQMTRASLKEISDFALWEGVRLSRSKIGFLGFLSEDAATLTIQSWSPGVMEQCAVLDQPMVYSVATGGLWAEAVEQRQPVIVNDYSAPHPRKKGYPAGHVELKRLLSLPVFDGDRLVAVAAVANKEAPYDPGDVRQVTLLMQGMWWLLKRQRAEEALTAEVVRGHLFQTKLIDTCMDAIIANDREGAIFLFNDNAVKMLGYTPEEVVGKLNVRELYPESLARDVKRKIYDAAFGEVGVLENYETVVRHKDGTRIPIWLSARLLYEEGREAGVIGHFRDLRERKKMEENLLKAERLALLGKMSAHISHEIKNPLMIIGGFARQVRDSLAAEPEKNREKLDIIISEIKGLEEFLAEVGSYTKFSEPKRVPGDLNGLIEEMARLLTPNLEEQKLKLSLDLDTELPPVNFDRAHLRQVFLNVIKNALEAMGPGGTLTITSARRAGGVAVQVADTGAGIPPENLDKLFQPFFSTKSKGSGLGLAICQRIMQAHGGEIAVESELNRGTRVTLLFKQTG